MRHLHRPTRGCKSDVVEARRPLWCRRPQNWKDKIEIHFSLAHWMYQREEECLDFEWRSVIIILFAWLEYLIVGMALLASNASVKVCTVFTTANEKLIVRRGRKNFQSSKNTPNRYLMTVTGTKRSQVCVCSKSNLYVIDPVKPRKMLPSALMVQVISTPPSSVPSGQDYIRQDGSEWRNTREVRNFVHFIPDHNVSKDSIVLFHCKASDTNQVSAKFHNVWICGLVFIC